MAGTLRAENGAMTSGQIGNRISTSELRETWGVGPWIWSHETLDKQICRFWRTFEIPRDAKVTSAKIRISVDNGYHLMLDGRLIGVGSDWRSITEYDLGEFLKPGRHVLAVEGFNDNREAGMQFGMRIDLADGRLIEIISDTDWLLVPADVRNWEKILRAPADWDRAVEVSSLLPRPDNPTAWHERNPTSLMKVSVPPPVKPGFLQSAWFQVALWTFATVAALLCLRLMARLTVQSRAEAMLHTERARIARDIHDELGARLTELALEGEVAQTELPEGSPVRPKLEALCEKARAVSSAMDEVVWMVNSRRDTLRDFTNFACKHAQRFLSQTGIRCRLDVDGDLPEAPFVLPVRRSLLLGVKEALNNAAKYSNAAEIFLRIHRRGQSLLVIIEDNGEGFDLAMVDPSRDGLTNMVERMKDVGGECRIVTKPGAGCRVEFQVPLPNLRRRNQTTNPVSDPTLAAIRGVPPQPTAAVAGENSISPS
jgi:two-component sensor histidine kinase